jgi:biotin operon repressor
MSVNRGSIPMLTQVQAERKGKPLAETGKSRIRMALLAGERLTNREVATRFGVSLTALNDAIKDLERVGYSWGRDEHSDTGSVYWITNTRHIPKADSGPTRIRPHKKERTTRARARGNGMSHRDNLRTQLLSGKAVSIDSFCKRTGASPRTIYGYISKLRNSGIPIQLEDGKYVVDSLDSEEGEAAFEDSKRRTPPALGATLRCTQHTLVGKKIVAKIEDNDGNVWTLTC